MATYVLVQSATGGHDWVATSGTGSVIFSASPTFTGTTTMDLAVATSYNKVILTQPATVSTLTIINNKTLTVSNTLTLAGADGSTVTFGSGGTVIYASNKLSALSATTSAELAGVISDETGTGALVFANTPNLVTPALGVATATTINGLTINATTSGVLTIANSSTLATSGAFSITLTSTAATNVTLPLAGTLSTLSGTETFTNKTLTAPIISALSLSDDIIGVTGVTHTIRSANATGATVSYPMVFSSGTTVSANSGAVTVSTGTVSTLGNSGALNIVTGQSSIAGNSGDWNGLTGNVATGNSGQYLFYTGSSTTGDTGNYGINTGTASGGASGSINLTTGTATTIVGNIRLRATTVMRSQTAPTAMTGAATITVTAILGGIIVGTPTTGATRAYTLPTGVDLEAALASGIITGDSLDFSIINVQTTAATDTITLTASVGITIVGQSIIDYQVAGGNSTSRWRLRRSAAATFICYRIS